MEFFRKKGSKQVQGLEELSKKTNGGIMVEVGSAYGEGAEIFSKYFDKVYCIDPWVKSTADREKYFDEKLENNTKIIKMKGISKDFIDTFKNKSLDFVYIDANHNYEFVKKDIEMWLPKIKDNGFIGGHDYNFSFLGVIQAVHEKFDRPDWVFMDSSWLKQI